MGEKQSVTIREFAFKLLCYVAYHVDHTIDDFPDNICSPNHLNARSVGLPYKDIQRKIKRKFPECKTSVADIRRYALLLRQGRYDYPHKLAQRRPRPSIKRKKKCSQKVKAKTPTHG